MKLCVRDVLEKAMSAAKVSGGKELEGTSMFENANRAESQASGEEFGDGSSQTLEKARAKTHITTHWNSGKDTKTGSQCKFPNID